MKGLAREYAAQALAYGWRRDSLARLNFVLAELDVGDIVFIAPWAMLIDAATLIYRSYKPADVDRALNWDVNPKDAVYAYCDGSGNTGDKVAGIGVYVSVSDSEPLFIAENIGLGTNNRAELCAAWRALRAVPVTEQHLIIRTDSEYTIGALTKDWARNANAELITNIRLDLDRRSSVVFEHVDGHSGNEFNEVADRLANIGRKLVTRVSVYEG